MEEGNVYALRENESGNGESMVMDNLINQIERININSESESSEVLGN